MIRVVELELRASNSAIEVRSPICFLDSSAVAFVWHKLQYTSSISIGYVGDLMLSVVANLPLKSFVKPSIAT